MKVLHIITALDTGGAQNMLYQLLTAWQSGPDQHQVISLAGGGQLAQQFVSAGIPLQELGMRPGRLYPGKVLKLYRLIRAERPDLIQTWLYHADVLGGVIGRLACRAPVVWGLHHTLSSTVTLKASTRLVVRLHALLSRGVPTRVVCCSSAALETHAPRGYPRDKMLVIANGVDTARFQPDPSARIQLLEELQLPASTALIGMFARFHPQKDHRTLISAARLLHDEMPGVHFVLAGDGIDAHNSQLAKWISQAGVGRRVHLLGLRQDMPRLHAAMDLFTLTSSEGEALPLVLAEAMACGVPCVATDIGDVREMIGETGQCVRSRDARALAQAWISILRRPASERAALGDGARTRVRDHYELGIVSKAYRDLYRLIAP